MSKKQIEILAPAGSYEKAKIAFGFLETLAVNYEKGYYDERNEWACRLAWETISHLESMELYHKTAY